MVAMNNFLHEFFTAFIQMFLTIVVVTASLYGLLRYTPLGNQVSLVAQQFVNPSQSNWVQSAAQRALPQMSPGDLFQVINEYRWRQNLPVLSNAYPVCQNVGSLEADPGLASRQQIFGVCEQCIKAVMVRVGSWGRAEAALETMLESDSTGTALNSDEYNLLCVEKKGDGLVMLMAVYQDGADSQAVPESDPAPPQQAQPAPKNFTEDQLWQALIDYRRAHQKPDLQRNDRLCQYARERVAEHIEMEATVAPEEYPNQDKYPLDAHAGFAADAESGYAFEVTGVNELAENLAYWPTAEYPHHVIEWGWDTSTEGHREAQLTEYYDKACITGQDGFFVALFGK